VAFKYLLSEDARVAEPALLAGNYDNPQMYFFVLQLSFLSSSASREKLQNDVNFMLCDHRGVPQKIFPQQPA
jgi:hypothetical protein